PAADGDADLPHRRRPDRRRGHRGDGLLLAGAGLSHLQGPGRAGPAAVARHVRRLLRPGDRHEPDRGAGLPGARPPAEGVVMSSAVADRRRQQAAEAWTEFAHTRSGPIGAALLLAVFLLAVLTPVLVPAETLDVTRITADL